MAQFQNRVAEVEQARAALRAIDAVEQQLHIGWMFCGQSSRMFERVQHWVGGGGRLCLCAEPLLAVSDTDEVLPDSDSDTNVANLLHVSGSSEEEATPKGAKRTYRSTRRRAHSRVNTFLGLPVCLYALARLLAIGTSLIENIRAGIHACHRGKGNTHVKHPLINVSISRRPDGMVWPSVLAFLWTVYHSAAEGLPTKHIQMQEIQGGSGMRVALEDALVSDTSSDDEEDLGETSARCIRKKILDLQAMETISVGPGTLEGPRRYLQHGHATHLFWEYQALQRARQQPVASFVTFLRIFHRVFRTHLKFRKKQQHAECTVCSALKLAMTKAISIQERQQLCQVYMTHIWDQWRDRQVYWTFRTLSVSFFEQSQRLGARRVHAQLQKIICLFQAPG